MPDEATADLIFASDQANHNFARVLGDLRRSHLSIAHRLRSIRRDAAFVAAVAARYPGFALVANERCGSWYIPLAGEEDAAASMRTLKTGSAYFKSTDGHTGQWSFSMRRLNLHLLPLISAKVDATSSAQGNYQGKGGGCILVDSTRRGKRMPDALSKTVPMWCCVLNRVLFSAVSANEQPPIREDAQTLYTPPGVVSASENSQMLALVPAFVEGLLRLGVLGADVAAWRRTNLPNGKPLRPVWITPDMPWPDVDVLRDRFNVVLCCTSSHVPSSDYNNTDDTFTDGYSADYIQGAADDTENWAHGLTPELYWAHCDDLLATPEASLPGLIASLVKSAAAHGSSEAVSHAFTEIAIMPYLSAGQWTGAEAPAPPPSSSHVCQIVFVRQTTAAESWTKAPNHLQVGLGKQDKVAGRTLRYALPRICEFAASFFAQPGTGDSEKKIRILCPTGRDVSIGAALALLCYCFDATGGPRTADKSPVSSAIFNKDVIRVQLGRIMTTMPHANPSRATLQSVNSFLMDLPR